MYLPDLHKIWLATGDAPVYLEPAMANRHGLIAGATGTGKTVTLKVLAESFSDMGVPVFLADIKGDLSGMVNMGVETKHIRRSIDNMHIEGFEHAAYPVRFWDVYGKQGHPVRTTITEMGPDLLARLLGLNDTQSGILRIVFRIADDKGLLLLDLKDLRSMVQYVGDNAKEFKLTYGNISSQSVGAIQRALMTLEDEGAAAFFGEPALDIADWMDWDENDRGVMNILECQELFQHPLLYATFLLWMLTELYEMLPEAGDLDKPKLAFFFDEAHLLFDGAPKALVDKVEQVVRLIAPRACPSGSSLRIPPICPTACWARSATGCSTPCGPIPPRIRRPSGPPPSPSAPTGSLTLRRPSRPSAWVRPWSPCWTGRAFPPLWSRPVSSLPRAP